MTAERLSGLPFHMDDENAGRLYRKVTKTSGRDFREHPPADHELDRVLDAIPEALERMRPRTELVFRLRFGSPETPTLEEVGRQYNRTGERIRQVEDDAADLIRDILATPELHPLDRRVKGLFRRR
jgi:DNA-directed RNA polymerase sigma subunit (sigma70/sigma32)